MPAPGLIGNDTDVESDNLAVSAAPVSGPSHGTLTLHAAGSFTYTHDGSETIADTFVYQVCDDGAPIECVTATVDITVNPVNDNPPDLDLNGPNQPGFDYSTNVLSSTVGTWTSIVDPGLSVTDLDGQVSTAVITITNRPDGTKEDLDADVSGTSITKNWDDGNGVLSLTGPAPVADFQTVLLTVVYRNTENAQQIDLDTRNIEFVLNDGLFSSPVRTSSVTIE